MDTKRLLGGIIGGLAGGLVFGAMMHMMGMIGMVAGLVGGEGGGVGWLVHLGISALFGLGYGVVAAGASTSWGRALALGALYGAAWWVFGALVIMPAWMGMPVLQVGEMQLQSLMGHVVFGLVLGATLHAVLRTGSTEGVYVR